MQHLTRHDFAAVLDLLAQLEARAEEQPASLVAACVEAVASLIACSSAAWFEAGSIPVSPHEIRIDIAGPPRSAAIVLRREGAPFNERDRERARLLQPHLAYLYRQARRSAPVAWRSQIPVNSALTPRELEVMHWVACGKTDVDIGGLLAISPRTVQKHLEHIYTKLGVETRTAAAMRAGAGLTAHPS